MLSKNFDGDLNQQKVGSAAEASIAEAGVTLSDGVSEPIAFE